MNPHDIGELTPEDRRVIEDLEALDEINAIFECLDPVAKTAGVGPRGIRYRQTYRRRYAHLAKLFNQTLDDYFVAEAVDKASKQARKQARERGEEDACFVEPTPDHIEWWRSTLKANYKFEVKAMLAAFDEARNIRPDDRKRAYWRNHKLNKSAEIYRSGEDRPQKNNVERKLMSPEEKKTHDNAKTAARMREYRRRKRVFAKTRSISISID